MSAEKLDLKVVESAVSDDPYDLEQLKVDQDFLETTNVKKLLTTVPVRNPIRRTLCAFTRAPLIASCSPCSS